MLLINVIHILGASGSGTSTLGKEIENKFNYVHLDVDDYFWLPTNPPFIKKREIEESKKLLMNDISSAKKCVITGSLCGWGDVFIPIFDLIIRIEIPTEIRIERIKKREYERFGNRILHGGDMYETHKEFLEWSKSYDSADINSRSKVLHDCWLKNIHCKKNVMDGAKPLAEKINLIESMIK
ncbi:AAA family ATPase [Clostridium gasigenes]|nr:AAA family ATPase [Clostridium gasigenes]MBU3134037.1 AAA family ATPase [Clostridium gasigenes]MBU3137624.1 AAA family ATPase [Clostridium gasigenes]